MHATTEDERAAAAADRIVARRKASRPTVCHECFTAHAAGECA